MTTSRNILQILVLIGDTDAVKKKKKGISCTWRLLIESNIIAILHEKWIITCWVSILEQLSKQSNVW